MGDIEVMTQNQYLGADIAPLIAAASGPLGTNAQYLFSLEQELIKLGMQDDGLNDLLVSVKKLLAENFPDGVLRPGFA